MAFSLFSFRNRMINLVINDHSIRYLELKQANPPIAQRWGERVLPPGIISDGKIIDLESLSNIMDECVDEWKIHNRSIRFIVPDSFVIIRKISIPANIQDDEIYGYLYLEIGSSIHLPFEDPAFDIYPLGQNGKTKDILLFATPEKYVMEYAHLFANVKLNPIAADVSSLALYRLYYQLGQAHEKDILLTAQFDLTGVSLCIFEGTVPYVMRHFPLELDWEKWEEKQVKNEAVYQYKGEDTEWIREFEDVYHEIGKLMDFYRYSLNNGKKYVTKFLVSGDHPKLNLILDEVKNHFDLPIEILYPNGTLQEKYNRLPYPFCLSLGLALKEVR